MTSTEYTDLLNKRYAVKPVWLRRGQWLFLTLSNYNQLIAREIMNTDCDPSYKDENIDNFFNFLERSCKFLDGQ